MQAIKLQSALSIFLSYDPTCEVTYTTERKLRVAVHAVKPLGKTHSISLQRSGWNIIHVEYENKYVFLEK